MEEGESCHHHVLDQHKRQGHCGALGVCGGGKEDRRVVLGEGF